MQLTLRARCCAACPPACLQLNNWEQQWGAECSSMVFELPHVALELLVVLPCAQVRGRLAVHHIAS